MTQSGEQLTNPPFAYSAGEGAYGELFAFGDSTVRVEADQSTTLICWSTDVDSYAVIDAVLGAYPQVLATPADVVIFHEEAGKPTKEGVKHLLDVDRGEILRNVIVVQNSVLPIRSIELYEHEGSARAMWARAGHDARNHGEICGVFRRCIRP